MQSEGIDTVSVFPWGAVLILTKTTILYLLPIAITVLETITTFGALLKIFPHHLCEIKTVILVSPLL